MAQTLLSTRPVGRATSRTTVSLMSVGTLAARLGQAIHSPHAGAMCPRSRPSSDSRSARHGEKNTITSNSAPPFRSGRTSTPACAARLSANPSGPPSTATAWPDRMPSFTASGVPEYPLGGLARSMAATYGTGPRPTPAA